MILDSAARFVTYWADLYVERVLPTVKTTPRIHGIGSFIVGLIHARLLPEQALRLSHVSPTHWDRLLSAAGTKAVDMPMCAHGVSLDAAAAAVGCTPWSLKQDFLMALEELAGAKSAAENIAHETVMAHEAAIHAHGYSIPQSMVRV
jgi:hypothetical protein